MKQRQSSATKQGFKASRTVNWKSLVSLFLLISGILSAPVFCQADEKAGETRARDVVNAAISVMGGPKYLEVKNSTSSGRYFFFNKGRKSFARFSDWTVYQKPVKSRFGLGKGKRQEVTIFNLALEKGWKLEGEDSVEDIKQEEIENFKKVVKKDLDYLLRQRLDEEDLKLFYYGPNDISGGGDLEAVEFLDAANDSIVVFFDRKTHFPTRVETNFRDKNGVRHEESLELYNWHSIDGVMTPLRQDHYIDQEQADQRFVEEIALNVTIPDELFLEPQIKKK